MNNLPTIKDQNISSHIYMIRGDKLMLDFHLATIYAVETRTLKQTVRRNIDRFPEDFMFELADEEINWMVSQKLVHPKKSLEEQGHSRSSNRALQCFLVS